MKISEHQIRSIILIFAVGVLVVLLGGCAPDIAQPLAAEKYKNLAPDGTWCWFADPRAAFHAGRHKRTYAGWVNTAGDIQIAAYDHQKQSIETVDLHVILQKDDHCNPAILIRPDGRLIVFFSIHSGQAMFYRISKYPENISSWGPEMTLDTNTSGAMGYTYPNPMQLSDENNKIYLFWRGGNWKPTYSVSTDAAQWSPAKTFIQGNKQLNVRPYIKYVSNGKDSIHFAFTDGHPRNEENNNIPGFDDFGY